ncbi:hypothetical protein F4780DRAFT_439360 [Xylariomycetidae sp. FL0641]|nr:hypothetical protein F4780DRAFT_439360 [Xylariomycetidae sp. FL0641]
MATSSRFFANPTTTPRTPDSHRELLASLKRLKTHFPPVHTCSTGWSFDGFYNGPTSVAYVFFRLAALYPQLEFDNQSMLEWAEIYLILGSRVEKRAPRPNHCGVGDEAVAYLTMTAVLLKDSRLARQLCSLAADINSPSDDGSNGEYRSPPRMVPESFLAASCEVSCTRGSSNKQPEWLYGRAGYLYCLRLCRAVFEKADHPDTAVLIDETIESTVERMFAVPQPWVWHGKEYLGAAHGTIGIVLQMVKSVPSSAPRLKQLLASVLEQQFESGNFPSSLPAGSDRLVQFCHGGPGFVISLQSLLPYFPDLEPRIREAVAKAQSDIWQRGLLTKEPCLCHGIVGNALAFDDDKRYAHFMSFADSESIEQRLGDPGRNNNSAGLFTGEAGRLWTWAVLDKGLPKFCIGYNDV